MEKYLNKLWLAPMAGFTDSAFRQICLENGAGLVTTEMVSTKGLIYNSQSTRDLLFCNGKEGSTAVQLFGSEPEFFADAVNLPEIAPFPIIDINMGCPVPKVVKTGAGSALLNNFKLASAIIETTVLHSKKPVTVKFRTGWDSSHIVAVDFAKMCQDSGASAICLHGRTREQMYSGQADWGIIEKVAESVKIPVIASGGAGANSEHFRDVFEKTNVDAALAASIFHYDTLPIDKLKADLKNFGITTRSI